MNYFVLTHLENLVSQHTLEVDAQASMARFIIAKSWNEEDCEILLMGQSELDALPLEE